MTDSVIDKFLSTTGYLPPRNDEEMEAFEKIYSEVKIDKTFRVNVERIVNKEEQTKDGKVWKQ